MPVVTPGCLRTSARVSPRGINHPLSSLPPKGLAYCWKHPELFWGADSARRVLKSCMSFNQLNNKHHKSMNDQCTYHQHYQPWSHYIVQANRFNQIKACSLNKLHLYVFCKIRPQSPMKSANSNVSNKSTPARPYNNCKHISLNGILNVPQYPTQTVNSDLTKRTHTCM